MRVSGQHYVVDTMQPPRVFIDLPADSENIEHGLFNRGCIAANTLVGAPGNIPKQYALLDEWIAFFSEW